MKIGKISESVLKRSVLKNITAKSSEMENGAGVGSDCAIFSFADGFFSQAAQTFALCAADEIRYPIYRAVNSVAVSGAIPTAVSLAVLLPPDAEEAFLQETMRNADRAAKALGIGIAGGHTEVTAAVTKAVVCATVIGRNGGSPLLPGKAAAGQDIVLSKWIGLEGTALLAKRHENRLSARYPLHMIEAAAAFDELLSVVPEAATAVKSNVSAMHDVSGGGIFAALWELAESAGVGLAVDLKKIPIRQETVEVCEFFGISPYELLSGGCLLMTADSGEHLVQALEAEGIPAAVIGTITDNNDRVVINEEEKRFLERPGWDEINKI